MWIKCLVEGQKVPGIDGNRTRKPLIQSQEFNWSTDFSVFSPFFPRTHSALTKVCFKYYHGATGELRACTPAINIKNLDVWDADSDEDELDEFDPFIKLTLSGENSFD